MRIVKNENFKTSNLGFGGLGNGITVWDRTRERNNDYLCIAHIDSNRNISYRDVTISQEQKDAIENFAKTADPEISVSQDTKIFRTRPQ